MILAIGTALDAAEDTLDAASIKVRSLIELLSSESDEYIVNLKTDLEGQVLEALEGVMPFNKWGKDYLPSLWLSKQN